MTTQLFDETTLLTNLDEPTTTMEATAPTASAPQPWLIIRPSQLRQRLDSLNSHLTTLLQQRPWSQPMQLGTALRQRAWLLGGSVAVGLLWHYAHQRNQRQRDQRQTHRHLTTLAEAERLVTVRDIAASPETAPLGTGRLHFSDWGYLVASEGSVIGFAPEQVTAIEATAAQVTLLVSQPFVLSQDDIAAGLEALR